MKKITPKGISTVKGIPKRIERSQSFPIQWNSSNRTETSVRFDRKFVMQFQPKRVEKNGIPVKEDRGRKEMYID